MTKALLFLLLASCARPAVLTADDVVGSYSFELQGRRDVLLLRPDGTYRHAAFGPATEGRFWLDSMQGTTWLHLEGFDSWWQPDARRGELATFFQRRDGQLEIRVPGAPVWYLRRR